MVHVTSQEQASLEVVTPSEAGLEALHARIASRFARRGSRPRALAFLKRLLGPAEVRMVGNWRRIVTGCNWHAESYMQF